MKKEESTPDPPDYHLGSRDRRGVCGGSVACCIFGHRISNSGDAMTPSIRNGEVVLVDRLVIDMKELSRGQIVAFRPNGNKEVHFISEE